MNRTDKALAEDVLARLCEGAQIGGVRFGPVLQLLIADQASDKRPIRGQVYLNLESRWFVADKIPDAMPPTETEFPPTTIDEELAALCALREQKIARASLGERIPHLFLTLESGKVLCLNGHHDQYETWQLGIAFGDASEVWMVVARPGDEVAVWTPQSAHQ